MVAGSGGHRCATVPCPGLPRTPVCRHAYGLARSPAMPAVVVAVLVCHLPPWRTCGLLVAQRAAHQLQLPHGQQGSCRCSGSCFILAFRGDRSMQASAMRPPGLAVVPTLQVVAIPTWCCIHQHDALIKGCTTRHHTLTRSDALCAACSTPDSSTPPHSALRAQGQPPRRQRCA